MYLLCALCPLSLSSLEPSKPGCRSSVYADGRSTINDVFFLFIACTASLFYVQRICSLPTSTPPLPPSFFSIFSSLSPFPEFQTLQPFQRGGSSGGSELCAVLLCLIVRFIALIKTLSTVLGAITSARPLTRFSPSPPGDVLVPLL